MTSAFAAPVTRPHRIIYRAPSAPRPYLLAPECELPAAPAWWRGTRQQWQVAGPEIDAAYARNRDAQSALWDATEDYHDDCPLVRAMVAPYGYVRSGGVSDPRTGQRSGPEWLAILAGLQARLDAARASVVATGERWGLTLRAL